MTNISTQSKKLSIVIMAHPKRHEMAKALSKQLGYVTIVWDLKNNLWDTCRRAWLETDPSSEYCLVLQDDAIVPDNFRELAEARLAESEDRVYSFYAGKMLGSRIDKARAEGKDHLLEHMIYNEIALCIRGEHVENMVKFCDDRDAQNDQQINIWAGENGIRIKYVLPSLVDHRDEESIYRSQTGFNPGDKGRHAYWYIGHENK